MAYVFLDDGAPDARDYDSNYFYFNGSDSITLSQIFTAISGNNPNNPEVRSKVKRICLENLKKNQKEKTNKRTGTTWKEMISRSYKSLIKVLEQKILPQIKN